MEPAAVGLSNERDGHNAIHTHKILVKQGGQGNAAKERNVYLSIYHTHNKYQNQIDSETLGLGLFLSTGLVLFRFRLHTFLLGLDRIARLCLIG